jgi:hypothetical protein
VTYRNTVSKSCFILTINLLNFLNGLVQLPFLELFIIKFVDIKMKVSSKTANSLEQHNENRVRTVVWLQWCDGWPGSILMVKADRFNYVSVWYRFTMLVEHQFWLSNRFIWHGFTIYSTSLQPINNYSTKYQCFLK